MHLPDGVVTPEVSTAGFFLTLGVSAFVLFSSNNKMLLAKIPHISIVAAMVFISSLIYIPLGFTSVHFSFAPLAGLLLGPFSFFAVMVAVFLQWLLFAHGGITTLGVNILIMGMPALLSAWLFVMVQRSGIINGKIIFPAIMCGLISAAFKVFLGISFLVLSGYPTETFLLLAAAHIPVILGEGAAAGASASYLLKYFYGGDKINHETAMDSSA